MCIYKTTIQYKKRYIYLWKSDDFLDHFLVDNQTILRFETQNEYEEYICRQKMNVLDEGTSIEIPLPNELLNLQSTDSISFCNKFLDLWNLAIDVKNSFSSEQNLLDGNKNLYDKIFLGCNLESLAFAQKKYVPVFSMLERRQIKAIMNAAYRLFDCKI